MLLKASGVLTLIFFGVATFNSGFSVDNKKPNSIIYVQNSDDNSAYFATYNNTLDAYTEQIFDENKIKGGIPNAETNSKYKTKFKYHIKTDNRGFKSSKINIELDTLIGDKRLLELLIKPNRKINKYELLTNKKIVLNQFKVNDALLSKGKKYEVEKGVFLVYYMANTDKNVTISFSIDKGETLDVVLNEVSYDLLSNEKFSIKPRTEEMMTMPFVTNDAIIISKKLQL